MFKNYIKIAFRSLWKHKGYSALNILGLAVGMSAGFLIILYLTFNYSYDNYHHNTDRTYRVVTDIITPSDKYETPVVDWNILNELQSEFPEIEYQTLVLGTNYDIKIGADNYNDEILAANEDFFKIFNFKLQAGNFETALLNPMSVVITESAAQRYYGTSDVMGKTFKFNSGAHTATITGIMADLPENTLLKGEFIISMSSYFEVIDPSLKQSWANFENYGFIVLNEGADPAQLEAKIDIYNQKAHGEQMKATELTLEYFLEPIADVHLYSNRGNSAQIDNMYIFSIVALFIILIAAINFINLTTARSVERAKEVGIRKVVGAQKNQLAFQFFSESTVVCLLAFAISVGITQLALPYFNELAGVQVASSIASSPFYIVALLILSLLIACIAGVYPALVLSSFQPIKVLKGKFSNTTSGGLLRKGLVISQFTISLVMIISTMIVYNQTDFMRNQDLGFSKNQLMIVQTDQSSKTQVFLEKLSKHKNILSFSTGNSLPGGGNNDEALSKINNKQNQEQTLTLSRYEVDEKFIPQLGIEIIAGRNFSPQFASDSTSAMIINEKTMRLLGFDNPEDALGKAFEQWDKSGQIVGVIKDFHMSSLQEEIAPLSIVYSTRGNRSVNMKISAQDMAATMADIETTYRSIFTDMPYDYFFLDEHFNRQYRSEEQFARLFLNFAILAIFISCLGLLGLASYSTLQRKREIGIRKVLGASATKIVHLVSINFLKLVGISILIASPIAYYIMDVWLEDFAYRIDIGIWVFITAGVVAMTIAVITVAGQAIKAAIANPVKSLKTE